MPEKPNIESENVSVSAVRHQADSDRWIFLCHGFGANKEGSMKERCKFLSNHGWNAVRFDFRGNGESSGDFIEQTLSSKIEDLRTVIDHFDPESCVIFGSSFGGKVAFHSAIKDDRIEAVIGKAPALYNKEMERFRAAVEENVTFEYIEGKPIDERFLEDLDQNPFSLVEESLEVPVLMIHGDKDTTVHLEHNLDAVEALNSNVALEKLHGENHRFSDEANERMLEIMIDWVDRSL